MPHFGGPACAARWQSLVQRRVQLVKSLFIPWPAGMPVLLLRGRPLLHADLFSNGHELWQRPGSPDRRAVEVWMECGAPPSPNRPQTGEIYNGVPTTRAQRRFRYRALAVLHTSATRLTCKACPRCYLSVRCHAEQIDRLRPSRTFPASLRVFHSH